MNDLSITINDARTTFAPGEELCGSATWATDSSPQKLELRLFWFTRGKGTEDAGMVETMPFEKPLSSETRSFRFRLPAAPYSFSGQLISLVWALELVAYPSKQVVRKEIEVGPGKHEVRLETVTLPKAAKQWFSVNVR